MKNKVSEDGTKLVATYELNAIHSDRTGALKPWTISQVITFTEIQLSDVFGIPDAVFSRFQQFHLHPEFYTKSKYNSAVEVVAEIGHVGKTSYVIQGSVCLKTSRESLCSFNSQFVHVDLSTRQPTALPENLRRKTKGPRPAFSLPVPPNMTPMYSFKFTVGESDIDINGHTNYSVYIRLCSDTAAFGTKAGRYTSLSGDFLKYPVKKIAMLFQKESSMGDVLEVQSWEIPSKPVSLLFQVKRGEDDIVRCLFELYERERAKL